MPDQEVNLDLTPEAHIIADALRECFIEDPTEDQTNIVEAIIEVADALKNLGNGNASTPMGALEALSVRLSESLDLIATSLNDVRG